MFTIRLLTLLFSIFCIFISDSYSQGTKPSYWIWAGIQPDHQMEGATLYVYQGHLHCLGKRVSYERIGLAPHPLSQEIYLVFRVTDKLPDPKFLHDIFLTTSKHWEQYGVKVLGVQLDFDSPTSKLLIYNRFLQDFRRILPSIYKLSITGLSDWIVFGDQKILRYMSEVTDEIVFQLYQNRNHFDEIEPYLFKLPKLYIPFKIGLLYKEDSISYVRRVEDEPHFKGVLMFVQKKEENR